MARQKLRLTDTLVTKLAPEAKSFTVWDSQQRGFGLRMLASGKATFLVRYAVKRNGVRLPERQINIGDFPSWNVSQAREYAGEIRKKADEGIDIQDEWKALTHKSEVDKSTTFKAILDMYIELYAKRNQRHWQTTQRVLTVDFKSWHDRQFSSITKAEAYAHLEKFASAGTIYKAGTALRWLKALARWAESRDLIQHDVFRSINLHLPTPARERFYSDDELLALWSAADQLDRSRGHYLKFLILSGCRKREISLMRWSELSEIDGMTVLVIPPERCKSSRIGKPKRYYVPLTGLMQRVLKAVPKSPYLESAQFVFWGKRKGSAVDCSGPLQAEIQRLSGIPDFRFHDLRHTMATYLSRSRTTYDISLALNHEAEGLSVSRKYSHAYPLKLKLEILSDWNNHVEQLVTPAGTVKLRP